eukprot:GSA120T00013977001.1
MRKSNRCSSAPLLGRQHQRRSSNTSSSLRNIFTTATAVFGSALLHVLVPGVTITPVVSASMMQPPKTSVLDLPPAQYSSGALVDGTTNNSLTEIQRKQEEKKAALRKQVTQLKWRLLQNLHKKKLGYLESNLMRRDIGAEEKKLRETQVSLFQRGLKRHREGKLEVLPAHLLLSSSNGTTNDGAVVSAVELLKAAVRRESELMVNCLELETHTEVTDNAREKYALYFKEKAERLKRRASSAFVSKRIKADVVPMDKQFRSERASSSGPRRAGVERAGAPPASSGSSSSSPRRLDESTRTLPKGGATPPSRYWTADVKKRMLQYARIERQNKNNKFFFLLNDKYSTKLFTYEKTLDVQQLIEGGGLVVPSDDGHPVEVLSSSASSSSGAAEGGATSSRRPRASTTSEGDDAGASSRRGGGRRANKRRRRTEQSGTAAGSHQGGHHQHQHTASASSSANSSGATSRGGAGRARTSASQQRNQRGRSRSRSSRSSPTRLFTSGWK